MSELNKYDKSVSVMVVVNKDLMRTINRLAILHMIRDVGAISRVDISRATGLSQSAVTGITAELLEEGIIVEKPGSKGGGGRRPVPLAFNPQGVFTVGVHLSVNQLIVVLLNLQAEILYTSTVPLHEDGLAVDTVVDTLTLAVQTCLWESNFSKNQIAGIGIAVPGLIDSRKGAIYSVPNYGWRDVQFAQLVAQRTGVPVYVENSANALVLFEQWFGVGRGTDNFLFVFTEHGIGMGMVAEGKMLRGARGLAGEFGHIVVDRNGPACRCGEQGCLEAICSNNAILRDAQAAVNAGAWKRESTKNMTIEEILAEVDRGNESLRAIYKKVGERLGVGLNNLCKVFDPQTVVLSGKGVLAGEHLFAPMRTTLHEDISFQVGSPVWLHVQKWEATNYAKGAGVLVLEKIYNAPADMAEKTPVAVRV